MASRRILVPAIAGAVVVVLAIATVTVLVATRPAGAAMRNLTYAESTGDVPSPERGWYDRIDTILTQRDFSAETAAGVTLVHSYVQLDAFRDGAPIDQVTLDQLTAGLAAVRAAGLKIVLRFAYNDGPGPDASQATILAHLQQLAPILRANDDVIMSVEAGFIGQWGEWHDSTHGLDTDPVAKKAILAAILAAVPANRDVALRYPSDIRALEPATGSAAIPDGSAASRIGNHQDCFLSSDPDDVGTWSRDGHTPAEDKSLVAGLGRHAVVGGETCAVSPRTNCTTALQELAQMHFTYLNRDYDPASLATLRQGGCADEIGQRLGYRLALTSAKVSELTKGAGEVSVEAAVRNSGFASPVNARPVYLVVRNGDRTWTEKIASDPRGWEPGTTTTVRGVVSIPGGLPVGATTVSLWLPDAAADLRDRPAYAIRFANDGTWDAGTGENVLERGTVAR
jgi:hypothetical protein